MADEETNRFKIAQILSLSDAYTDSRFSRDEAARALAAKNGNVEAALYMLLKGELAHEPPDALEQQAEMDDEDPPRDGNDDEDAEAEALRLAGADATPDTAADVNANTQTRAIMQVVVPPGVGPGMPLQVRVPDGRTVQVVVPPGVGPGMPLQVQVPPLDAAERRRLEDAARIYERGSQQQAAALAMTRAELDAYRRERLHERAELQAERKAVRVADGLARRRRLPMNQSKFQCQLYREIMCAIRGLDSLDPDARAALVREGVDLVGIARGSDAPFRTDQLKKLEREDDDRSLYADMLNRPEWPHVCGGKKSRKRRTKRRHKTGGKKSRKQRKRATIKGGKRKRRRTRRRR